jgi:superfamily II DNA or RNA helicase
VRCLFRPDPEQHGVGEWAFWSPDGDAESALAAWIGDGLPELGKRRVELIVPTEDPEEGDPLWSLATVTAKTMPLQMGISLLSRVETSRNSAGAVPPSDAIAAWSHATKFALELLAAGRFLPTLEDSDDPELWAATWGVVLARDEDRDRFRQLARAMPPCAHAWPAEDGPEDGAEYDDDPEENDGENDEEEDHDETWHAEANGVASEHDGEELEEQELEDAELDGADQDDDHTFHGGPRFTSAGDVLRDFLDASVDTLIRQAATGVELPAPTETTPPWVARWLEALTGPDPTFEPEGLPERHLPDELWAWSRHALGAGTQRMRLLFDLTWPRKEASDKEPWRLGYGLQSTDDPDQVLPMASVWAIKKSTTRLFHRTVHHAHDTVLRSLGEAARTFAPIERSLAQPRPTQVKLRLDAVWKFLSGSGSLLRLMGHGVKIPPEIDTGGARRLHAQLEVAGSPHTGESNGHAIPWDAPARFKFQIVLDGKVLSGREFQTLMRVKGELRRWKGRWVCIDPTDLATLTRIVHGMPDGRGSLAEAVTFALRGSAPIAPDAPEVPVVAVGELAEFVDALHERGESAPEPEGFQGQLRGYQRTGLGWLVHMQKQGVGVILADEMGLGKTPMTLALLERLRRDHAEEWRPTLLVCPTSVLGNWEREATKFTPELPVRRHHGPDRVRTLDEFEENCPAGALVMTTYATARLDADLLAEIEWAGVVIDEAQNIKNPGAAQTRALRRIKAPRRLALTGTPVENRLVDLWSILDWCNHGLLGPLAEFRRTVARPIERFRDPHVAGRLRRMVEPFVLRRLKTDPNVAPDLPDKVEATVACSLSSAQIKLYRKTIKDTWKDIKGKTGIERAGRVLALLTALKQICNHPSHFLKKTSVKATQSGKLARLGEMLEEIVDQGDRVLLFTQYVEMGKLLVKHLQSTLGIEVPFLHGGVPARTRDAMVQRFQEDADAPPVFLLSLKAGGTGLNLTRASHVFHYDHWWNPAVESQATDRAHRIGQTRTVYVHRLVSLGTLEEKIAHMLEQKKGLANLAYGDGEQWLTELADDELRALVELSDDAVEGEEA